MANTTSTLAESGAGLHDKNGVTGVALVLLVVSVILFGLGDELSVNGMLLLELGGNYDGLVHLVARHNTLAGLS